MRSARDRRLSTALATPLITAALLTACGPAGSTASPSSAPGDHAYTICPPSGELPATDINDRAVEVLDSRLGSLGVETSSIGVGAACIDVTASTTSVAQDAAVRAAVLGTGTITLVAPPAGTTTVVGASPPDGTATVLSGLDFRSAEAALEPSNGRPVLTIRFSDVGSATIAGWSRLRPGAPTALVVDGVVVALPATDELRSEGMTVSLDETPPVPLETIVAMITSGPLPPEWAQPERPQG